MNFILNSLILNPTEMETKDRSKPLKQIWEENHENPNLDDVQNYVYDKIEEAMVEKRNSVMIEWGKLNNLGDHIIGWLFNVHSLEACKELQPSRAGFPTGLFNSDPKLYLAVRW